MPLHSECMKCPRCNSTKINKNGHHHGKQNYICKQCNRQFVEFYNSRGYSEDARQICLHMYASGVGFRAIERATGISHNTIINWLKQANTVLPEAPESEENSDTDSTIHLDPLKAIQTFNEQDKVALSLDAY